MRNNRDTIAGDSSASVIVCFKNERSFLYAGNRRIEAEQKGEQIN